MDYANVDKKQLARDVDEIKKQIGRPDESDFHHLKKLQWWGRFFALVGYSTAWIVPFNIVSAFFIAIANVSRWANIAHPVLHGGYEKVPGIPKRYTRKHFASGWRRVVDWMDWIYPSAWSHEHNDLHHYHLGEKQDPDHMEHNMQWLRNSTIPYWLRYILVLLFAGIWKLAYYAPNTLKILENKKRRKAGLEEQDSFIRADAWLPWKADGFKLWTRFYLPYILFRFVFMPLLFLPLGYDAVFNVLMTSLLAEFIANIHSFIVIIPNHSAEDIYRFSSSAKSKGEFYLRQILGSVNYHTGKNPIDFMHGWLNYQIEHHLFPQLPLSQYQKIQPMVKQLCEKHKLPYRQENVFKRLKMSLDLMVGKTDLKVVEQF